MTDEMESLSEVSLVSRISTMMRVGVSVRNPNAHSNDGPRTLVVTEVTSLFTDIFSKNTCNLYSSAIGYNFRFFSYN